jgi:N-acetylglucosamine kinase-like BadF-type ATPase
MAAALDNPRATGAGFEYGDLLECSQSRIARLALRQRHLKEDFITAFTLGPKKHVRTPGWSDAYTQRPHATVEEVVLDAFSGERDESLAKLLAIVARQCKAGDSEAISLVHEMAAKYAAFHAGDEE